MSSRQRAGSLTSLGRHSTPRSLTNSQPQLATTGTLFGSRDRGATYAEELSAIASRRHGHEMTKATRTSSDSFLPSISGLSSPSDPDARREPLSPVSLPSTRNVRNGSDNEGGSATEVLRRLRASAIDRQRDQDSPSSMQGKLGAAQLLHPGLALNRKDGSRISSPSSPGASTATSPKDGSPKLDSSSPPQRERQLHFGTGTLAQRRRLLQPAALTTFQSCQSEAKGIRKLEEGEKIYDLYYWEEVLQEEGDGGKVVVCKSKSTPKDGDFQLVMKIRSKESLRKQQHEEDFLRSQVRMLNLPQHIGVMHTREILEDEQNYYIVMDKAKGGTLFHSLLKEYKDGVMPQRAIRNLTKEILEAVAHIHSQGILHRDIKPDNLVMQLHDDPGSPGGMIKKVTIIDFDHADTEFSPLSPPAGKDCYGTARFNSPEAFLGNYSPSSDLWSVGTILFLLMTGNMPYPDHFFDMESDEPRTPQGNCRWMQKVFSDMKSYAVDWNASAFNEHPTCKDFCKKLLAFDPADRFASAEEALKSPWFGSK